jgi:hypothetical protein
MGNWTSDQQKPHTLELKGATQSCTGIKSLVPGLLFKIYKQILTAFPIYKQISHALEFDQGVDC